MGQATIVENVGAGLYKIRLEYDLAALENELQQLRVQERAYWQDLLDAIDERDTLRQDRHAHAHALREIMGQWTDNLLEVGVELPQIIPEEADENGFNPATSAPYTDEERRDALEEEALTAVNAARGSAGLGSVERSHFFTQNQRGWLRELANQAPPRNPANDYLGMMARMSGIDPAGRTGRQRLLRAGEGVPFRRARDARLLGSRSPAAAVAALLEDPVTRESLLDPDANQLSVAYQYESNFPGTHLWSASVAEVLDPPASNADFFADPVGQAFKAAVSDAAGSEVAEGLDSGQPSGDGGGSSGGGTWNGVWSPNTIFGVGQTIQSQTGNDWMNVMRMTGHAGLSGETEPLWPGLGGTVIDNEIRWTVIAQIPPEVGLPVIDYYAMIGLGL